MRKFTAMPKLSDNMARDEETFRNTMWPLLERNRKTDRSIIEVERIQRGLPVNFWQLK